MNKRKRIILFSMVTLFFIILSYYWCDLWGSHNLGRKFVLLEGDKTEDRIIVYSTLKWGCCYTGIPIIPPKVNDKYTSHIDKVKSNQKFIIARSVNRDGNFSYWIVNKEFEFDLEKWRDKNCDSVLQKNIYGPFKFDSLKKVSDSLKVNISLTKIK